MTGPLVSICIPAYKGAAFLPATIESVLGQSYVNFELWIIDDASPDETERVVARFTDPRIRFVRNARNLGPQGNWNRCLAVATGRYFKLLPQDDLLTPGSLAEQVAVLEADVNERIAIVFGSRLIIDDRGRGIFRRGMPALDVGRIDGRSLIRRCIRAGSNMIGEPGNGLMRRTIALKVGDYSAEHPYLVDLDYWFRALVHGDGYYTGRRSSYFRISRGSWSVAIGRKQLEDWKGFVDQYMGHSRFGITEVDRRIGFVKARINAFARAMIYRAVLRERARERSGPGRADGRRLAAMQFVKFLAVGVLNTAFSYGLYVLFLWQGMNYAAANLSALVLGLAFSFKTQSALVFVNRDSRRFFRFVIVWAVLYGVSIFLISRFVALGFDSYQSGALAIPFTTGLSFLAQKFFVFRRHPAAADP